MRFYKMHCLKIRRRPVLKQLLNSMWVSWCTMLGVWLAFLLILTFTDQALKTNISEFASSFTMGCFFISVVFYPINVYILLMIQFSGLIPFLMCTHKLVCVESCVFLIFLIITQQLVLLPIQMYLLSSAILVILFSFIFMLLLKCKHYRTVVIYKRIMREGHTVYVINKEVDIFIIIMILLILLFVFISWV